MKKLQNLVYGKKVIFPTPMANALQSLNMAYAFASQGVETFFSPGNRSSQRDLQTKLEKKYALSPEKHLHMLPLAGQHKGLYGLQFRLNLVHHWITADKNTAFFARDIKEWLTILWLKKYINRSFFMEMHEVLADEYVSRDIDKANRYMQLERQIVNIADGIITTTESLARRVKELFNPKAPILVAPNGYNEKIFYPQPLVSLSEQISLLYCGSLHRGKGVESLLQSMVLLPDNFSLTVIGGTPADRLIDLKSKYKDLHDRINFVGSVSPAHISGYLEKSQIIVIPQTSDNFFSPIKLSEAMGTGLPTVVAPALPLKNQVTHCHDAYMASGKTPQDIAQAISYVGSHLDLAHFLQKNMRMRTQAQTWKKRAASCVDFINMQL